MCNDKPLLQRKGPYRWSGYCLLFVVLEAEGALPDDSLGTGCIFGIVAPCFSMLEFDTLTIIGDMAPSQIRTAL